MDEIPGNNNYPGAGKLKCLNCGKKVNKHSILEQCEVPGDKASIKRRRDHYNRSGRGHKQRRPPARPSPDDAKT